MSHNHSHSSTEARHGDSSAQPARHASEAGWGRRMVLMYRDGFRGMTVGRTLWAIIAIKFFVFFVIIRWLLFPDFLSTQAGDDQGKAQYVREQLTGGHPRQ